MSISEACGEGFHSNADIKGDLPLVIGNCKLTVFLNERYGYGNDRVSLALCGQILKELGSQRI